ncbi:hypothetical protein pb186bvf_003034 [Paramecium bursaria]
MLTEDNKKHIDDKKKNIPWVEKYRPSNLNDVIAHEEIVRTIKRFKDENQLPNLLLYGPPGTGKTSTIVALARQMYGTKYGHMVMELNASDDRGITIVRENIKRFAETQSISFQKDANFNIKLVILDEADAMTSAAQFALRRIIEKYSRSTRFCFICNYVSKIIPALQSRCTRFKFKQIPIESAGQRILSIAEREQIVLNDTAVQAIFKLCEGDMRRVVNMLQALSLSSKNKTDLLDDDYVYQFTGMASPKQINEILMILLTQDNLQQTYLQVQQLLEVNGISLMLLIKEIGFQLVDINLNQIRLMQIYKRLAEIEQRLAINCSERVIL